MTQTILQFAESPTQLVTYGRHIAAIVGQSIVFVRRDKSFSDLPPLKPIALDFVNEDVVAYGTDTGALGVIDYRARSHEIFAPSNNTYPLYSVKTCQNQVWAAADAQGHYVAMFDLRNLAHPVVVSDVLPAKVVAIHQKKNRNIMAITVNGYFFEYSDAGKLLARQLVNTTRPLLDNIYNSNGDYFVSLYEDYILVHNQTCYFDDIEGGLHGRKGWQRLLYCDGYYKIVFVGEEGISVCTAKCREIYNIRCSNSVASAYESGFLYCNNGFLCYEGQKL